MPSASFTIRQTSSVVGRAWALLVLGIVLFVAGIALSVVHSGAQVFGVPLGFGGMVLAAIGLLAVLSVKATLQVAGTVLTIRRGAMHQVTTMDLARVTSFAVLVTPISRGVPRPYYYADLTDDQGGKLRLDLYGFTKVDRMQLLPMLLAVLANPQVTKSGPTVELIKDWYDDSTAAMVNPVAPA